MQLLFLMLNIVSTNICLPITLPVLIKNLAIAKLYGLHRFNSLIFIRPSPNNLYYYLKSKSVKFVSMLQLGQNYLLKDKLKYSFQYTLNPICHGRRILHTLSLIIPPTS